MHGREGGGTGDELSNVKGSGRRGVGVVGVVGGGGQWNKGLAMTSGRRARVCVCVCVCVCAWEKGGRTCSHFWDRRVEG